MKPYLWYRTTLDPLEGAVYDAMRAGILADLRAFRVPKCEAKRLSRVLELVRMDDPEIAYVNGFNYLSARGEETLTLQPVYTFSGRERAALMRAISARTERILAPYLSLDPDSALEELHGWVLSEIRYDKIKKPYSHEIIGPLQHGIGVCEGIARTVQLFCNRLEIPAITVLGKGRPEHAPETGQRHAWNLIRTGGVWRYYDFTYDLTASGGKWDCRRYYAMSEEACLATHGPSQYPLPVSGGAE